MAGIGDILGKVGLGGSGGGFIQTSITIFILAVVLGGCGFGLWWFIKRRKNWNIKVEFKIPRNIKEIREKDGSIRIIGTLNKEWGKGSYDAARGVVSVKRKGIKAVVMKPFDVKQYLSNGNILTVIQTGIGEYRPVLDESYIEVEDNETGEGAALLRTKIDTSESKAWKNSFERDCKSAYTIKNWLAEHGALVGWGIVVFMILAGFAIVIQRLPKCGVA